MNNPEEFVITIGCDLLSAGRIEPALANFAAQSGTKLSLRRMRRVEDLPSMLAQARIVVIDLAKARDTPIPDSSDPSKKSSLLEQLFALLAVERAKAASQSSALPPVLAFGPHVETELLREAVDNGCDEVVPRSQLPAAVLELLQSQLKERFSAQPESAEAPRPRTIQDGVSALTAIVFGAIIASVLYVAYSIAPFYYYYYELQNHFDQMIPVAATETDLEIRRRLLYYVRRYELPVDEEQLQINRSGRSLSISLHYRELFLIEWDGKEYFRWEFPFYVSSEGAF